MDMRDLVDFLNYHTKLYDEGQPVISDKEWDNLYFQLQQLENDNGIILSDSPTQKINYQIVSSLQKVKHSHLMLSLDKTKKINDIVNFGLNHQLICMAKIDGLTCSIRYLNGKLVSAETRGNGVIGEDITHNISHVLGVPLTLPVKQEVIIDGEIICRYDNFEQFKDEYANPRNFAAGSIRLLDSQECARRKLSFIAWDCIKGLADDKLLSDKFYHMCQDWKFIPAPWITLLPEMIKKEKINHVIYLLKNWAKEEYIPIDGLVFKYDNCEYYQSLGVTGHHARGGLAYKFYDEEYETKLKNIEWGMGRTGELTPVAIFDPVDDGESITTRASLHNISIMKKLLGFPYLNQKIKMAKMNMIIPQITWGQKTEDDANYFLIPKTCPICGGRTEVRKNGDVEILVCTNDLCDGKLVNKLDHFCGRKGLDIRGLSKATLQKLIDWGWVGNIIEIFSLSNFEKEWKSKPGFGERSVANILNAIEESKNCELYKFISALGIPLIGETYAKEICKHEHGWIQIREDIEGGYDFTEWDGFGEEMNKALHDFNYSNADNVANILNLTNSLYTKNSSININKKVCITGSLKQFKNRAELVSAIEQVGGKVVSSVSKNTDILINNDNKSTSTKNLTAQKLNIPVLTEEEFISQYLTL